MTGLRHVWRECDMSLPCLTRQHVCWPLTIWTGGIVVAFSWQIWQYCYVLRGTIPDLRYIKTDCYYISRTPWFYFKWCHLYTIILLKSVYANCRSQLLVDHFGRCLKLFVSTDGPSSHEFGLAFFVYARKTQQLSRKSNPAQVSVKAIL